MSTVMILLASLATFTIYGLSSFVTTMIVMEVLCSKQEGVADVIDQAGLDQIRCHPIIVPYPSFENSVIADMYVILAHFVTYVPSLVVQTYILNMWNIAHIIHVFSATSFWPVFVISILATSLVMSYSAKLGSLFASLFYVCYEYNSKSYVKRSTNVTGEFSIFIRLISTKAAIRKLANDFSVYVWCPND